MLNKKQWICKFIALFIFLTGMCFEEVKADSAFVCTIIPETVSYVQAADTIDSDMEVYAAEALVARNTSATHQIVCPMTSGKRDGKLSVVLLYVTALWLLLSDFYAATYIAQIPERVCKTVVVNYIHNTDGKKRV